MDKICVAIRVGFVFLVLCVTVQVCVNVCSSVPTKIVEPMDVVGAVVSVLVAMCVIFRGCVPNSKRFVWGCVVR